MAAEGEIIVARKDVLDRSRKKPGNNSYFDTKA
jgi:hypothetical protein